MSDNSKADDYGEDSPFAHTQKVDTASAFRDIVLRSYTLRVIEGTLAGREVAVEASRVRVGSHEDNDLVVDDPAVSRHHLTIEPSADGFLLRDLDSTNGTFVDTMRIKEAYLPGRTVICLGSTRLQFSPREERISIHPSSRDQFGPLVGASLAMRQVFGVLERFAPTDLPLLIGGETGTGKELAARGIHLQSPRRAGPFRVFDCSCVARNLVESELFGHMRGAFTGAEAERVGTIELAHKGTLFIDEIGELPLDLQPKLLRTLEMKETRRLGASESVKVDTRVVAATHRDLARMVSDGQFREDLYYRLNVVKVELPPLRERLDDLPLLVDRLIADQCAGELGKGRPVPRLSAPALDVLRGQDWKGNVRQLRNVIQAALVLAQGDLIGPGDLLLDGGTAPEVRRLADPFGGKTLEQIEKEAIRVSLEESDGNKSRVAKKLGIAYSTLLLKIKKYGLEP